MQNGHSFLRLHKIGGEEICINMDKIVIIMPDFDWRDADDNPIKCTFLKFSNEKGDGIRVKESVEEIMKIWKQKGPHAVA